MTAKKGKPRARGSADHVRRGAGDVQPKNFSLSEEARERIGVSALKWRKTEGEIVDWLVCTHLRRFVVSDRGDGTADDLADEANNAGPVATAAETLTPPEGKPQPSAAGEGSGHPRPNRGTRKAG